MTAPPDKFARRQRMLQDSMDSALRAVQEQASLGKGERILWNLEMAARDALCMAMLALRSSNDRARARAHLARGAAVGEQFLEQAGRGVPGAAFFAHSPIYCALLSDSWETARRLSRWAADQRNGDPRFGAVHGDVFARRLAAFVVDEAREHDERRGQPAQDAALAKDPFWKWLTVYLDLYAAVLRRDQGAFDAAMQRRARDFTARARDRGFGDLRPEFGGGAQQDFVLDFMGAGIVKVARQRGLRYEGADPFMPEDLMTPA